MKILTLFLFLMNSVWANPGSFSSNQQHTCLCQVSGYCEPQDSYYWLSNSHSGGNPLFFLGGSQPQIFEFSLQGERREIGRNIYLAEIPSSPESIPLALHFDEDGRVTHYQRLEESPAHLQAGLAHWNRMRFLQTVLFEEFGVSPRQDERGFGTTLLIESYQWGLFESADPNLGRNLRQLVSEYDQGLAAARQFERDHRGLFSDCHGYETLCQYGPNGTARVQATTSLTARNQWNTEFERLVRIFTKDQNSSLEQLCQRTETESEESVDPSSMQL